MKSCTPQYLIDGSRMRVSVVVTYFEAAGFLPMQAQCTAFKLVTKVSFMVINQQWLSSLFSFP